MIHEAKDDVFAKSMPFVVDDVDICWDTNIWSWVHKSWFAGGESGETGRSLASWIWVLDEGWIMQLWIWIIAWWMEGGEGYDDSTDIGYKEISKLCRYCGDKRSNRGANQKELGSWVFWWGCEHLWEIGFLWTK